MSLRPDKMVEHGGRGEAAMLDRRRDQAFQAWAWNFSSSGGWVMLAV
jgi:hypothetical protein